MDDESPDCTLARRFLELVCPSAVVGHRFGLEEVRVGGRRLVDDHQYHLALDVRAFEIVPAIFRRLYSISDEDDRRIDVDCVGLRLIVGDVVVAELEVQWCSVRRQQRQ